MSEKEELQLSVTPKTDPIASEDPKVSQFNDEITPEKLESSDATLASPQEQNGFVLRPPEYNRRLVRRIDWHVVPAIVLLYWLLNLSESQIGKARVFGLEADLHMTGIDFNIAAVAFTVPHIIFAIPANLILRFVRPKIWLSCISHSPFF